MDLEQRFAWIQEPLSVSNYVKGVERCVQSLQEAANSVWRRRWERELRDILQRLQGRMTSVERAKIVASLKREPALWETLAPVIPSRLDDGGLRPPLASGKSRALFVMTSEPPFGCLQTLTAAAHVGSGGRGAYLVNVPQSGIDTAFKQALTGAQIALSDVLLKRGLDARGKGALETYDFPMELQHRWRDYEGDSIGLAAAMAMLSSLIGQAIPSTAAFTGYVKISGEVKPVTGIAEKVEAALDKGMTRIYIPAGNLADVPPSHRGAATGVSQLADVVGNVFEDHHIAMGIARLNQSRLYAAQQEEVFARKARGGEKVLISCVGARDPYGAPVNVPSAVAEGAILTAFRKVLPRAVCLLGAPHLNRPLALTNDFLNAIVHPAQCLITPELIDVADPTVYDNLAEQMGEKIRLFLDDMQHAIGQKRGIEPYVVVSSGTPQMQAIWIYLLQTEPALQGARVLQVREPQFVRAGEERVREVVSHHLGIGVG